MRNKGLSLGVFVFIAAILIISSTYNQNAFAVPEMLYAIDVASPYIYNIDPADGSVISSVEINLDGARGGTGLATDPTTGQMWALVKIQGGDRVLVQIEPSTGATTEVANVGHGLAGIAFGLDGTMYAVSGDGADDYQRESLFTINKNNGSTSFICALGNGNDGENIALNPNDEKIWHFSGYSAVANQVFEIIENNSCSVTDVPLSGAFLDDEPTGMTFSASEGLFLISTRGGEGFYSLTTSGVAEFRGYTLDYEGSGTTYKGLAFTGQPPQKRVCVEYDFDEGVPEEFSGVTTTQSVEGFTAEGFSNNYLRNSAVGDPASKTTLTLTNLPNHNIVDIGFLLAIIDSWDGETDDTYSPDIMNVEVDGQSIFSEGFVGAGGVQSYVPSPGVLLLDIQEGQDRAVSSWADSAYDMSKEGVFRGISHTSDTLTIDWFASGNGWQGGNDESWAIDNLEICTDTFVPPKPEPEPQPTEHKGGENQWDTRPTFGISHETRQGLVVENGFSFNGEYFTITDNHHTDFEEQAIQVGTMNSFSATVYADKKLKVQEFLFGIPKVGESHLAELGIEVWYDLNGEIEDVKVVQKSDVIDPDTISISHEMVKCLSTDAEARCDKTTASMKFLEPLEHKVMAIKAIDHKNRDQKTHLNEGFNIFGDSLNPMVTKMIPSNNKYEGLLKVTQVSKYSPYWKSEDGRMFEMNSFGSFKEINQSFERFQDTGDARTRMHSGYGGIIQYEQNRATQVFDATKIISDLPDSFGYHFEMTERINEKMKQEILLQQEIANGVLEQMDKQDRYY